MGGFDDMTAAEALRALADDWEYNFDDLYVNLRQGTEARWGVDCDDEGSVSGTLRMIADRACEEQGALRVFAERVHGMLWGEGWHPLDEIADRLGEELSELDRTRCHEPEELDDGGCYDGMVHPVDDEDYEAAVWVRGHGGLDAVRERLGERKRLVDRLHAYKDALDMMADSMGVEKSSDKIAQARRTRKAVKSLERRLIPDGVEWPRFEDGEPVRIGDKLMTSDGAVRVEELSLTICDTDGGVTCVPFGERVKRPSVLAADGEPLEVGQTVWNINNGMEFNVSRLPKPGEYQAVEVRHRNGSSTSYDPCQLTHQRPVLDADGVPIHEGDTVYLLPGEWCDEFPCLGFHGGEELEVFADGEASHVPGGVQCRETEKKVGFRGTCYPQPSQLTHAKPEPSDSWDRWRREFIKPPCDYCRDVLGVEFDRDTELDRAFDAQVQDMERRAKALAERERGE